MIWPHCDGLFWPHPSRATIERAFGRPLRNVYGTSETGTLAESRLPHFEFQLIEDVVVVEPVDAAGRPTEPGQASDRIFVTNVVNRLLPLIRYEINDQLGLLDSRAVGPQTGRLLADVAGRSSDDFWYGGVRVAASALRALLTAEVDIEAYQVRQQPVGVTILFVSRTSVDTASLTDRIRKQLERAGLDGPVVEVTRVEHLRREGMVQKLRRFVPLQPR